MSATPDSERVFRYVPLPEPACSLSWRSWGSARPNPAMLHRHAGDKPRLASYIRNLDRGRRGIP
jgi:hypothetical protein